MKILFLTYHGFDPSSGITKKMLAQIKGLRQNGHEVHVCYYDFNADGERCRYVDDKIICNYGYGLLGAFRQRLGLDCIVKYCLSHQIGMIYVRHFMNSNPWVVQLFGQLRQAGILSAMEIPTYPYDQEFQFLPFKHKFSLFFDKLYRRRLASQVNAIVTFSDEKEIFGQQTINISNGIDFDELPLHQFVDTKEEIHLIGVAEVHPWHGFDRLIRGLGEYYNNKNVKPVFFHVVGQVRDTEMYGTSKVSGFAPIIEKYGIEKYVIFHGPLYGEQLNEVFNMSTFAVGSLGRHRSGITKIKTLKNREYAGRGIPFIYSETDSDFDDQPFVMKASSDETPIDIQSIVDFIGHMKVQPKTIRASVSNLSWKYQMQLVLDQLKRIGSKPE